MTVSLLRRLQNWEIGRCLVSISTSLSLEGTLEIGSSWHRTLSRMKCKSNSMCLDREWKTGLVAHLAALWLSHHKMGGEVDKQSS